MAKRERPPASAVLVEPLAAGVVDRDCEYMVLGCGDGFDEFIPVALVAPSADGTFTVEVVMPPDDPRAATALPAAVRELRFYLVEKGERNPWAYAKYHTSTAANAYSSIHWAWITPGHDERDLQSHA